MGFLKRIVSLLLLCALVLGMVPVTAFASRAEVQEGTVSATGTGSFGQLLSQEINAQQASRTAYPYGYGVSGLVFDGNTARAELEAAGDALLVVALYTDDGNRLLSSATAAVSTGDTWAGVPLKVKCRNPSMPRRTW